VMLATALASCSAGGGDRERLATELERLKQAAARGDVESVSQLLEAHPGIAHVAWEGSDGPLIAAARGGHLGVIETLLAAGAEPRERGGEMHTPLHAARDPETVDRLLDAGIPPDVRSRDGQTPAMTLVRSPEALERLLERGARTEPRDVSGRTALHHAAGRRGPDSLRSAALLCGRGADPDILDEAGATARDAAGEGAVARALLAAGGPCDELRGIFEREGPIALAAAGASVDAVRCETGDAPACGQLGRAYERGEGVGADLPRSAELYRKGCDGGHAWSCYALGFSYRGGEGVARSDERAVALFRQACVADYAPACGQLAWHLSRGRGVERDETAAATLFQKACDGEDEGSCRRLAEAYAVGRGVPRDVARAVALWRRACAGGDRESCGK